MIRRIREWEPAPVMVALVAVLALLAGAVAFLRANQAYSRDVETRAATSANQTAFCNILRLYLDPKLPPTTTERGRKQLQQFRREYDRLKCSQVASVKPVQSPR